jgi:hypothetical protein
MILEIELKEGEWELLMLSLGLAAGTAIRDGNKELMYRIDGLKNTILVAKLDGPSPKKDRTLGSRKFA